MRSMILAIEKSMVVITVLGMIVILVGMLLVYFTLHKGKNPGSYQSPAGQSLINSTSTINSSRAAVIASNSGSGSATSGSS